MSQRLQLEGLTEIADAIKSSDVAKAREEEINAYAAEKMAEITTLADTEKSDITTLGSTEQSDITTLGDTEKSAITAEGARVLASIPEDYTELSEEVSSQKEEIDVLAAKIPSLSLNSRGNVVIKG